MTDPTPNIPLLRKVIGWAEVEAAKPLPEREWAQGNWVTSAASRTAAYGTPCGTAFCIAGYAAHVTVGLHGETTWVDMPGTVHVQDFAEAELGLTSGEANLLFSPGNNIEDVRFVANEIAARAGKRL